MPDIQMPVYLTVADVVVITKIGKSKVYALIESGELPGKRIGRSIRIRSEVLAAWLDKLPDCSCTSKPAA